MNPLRLLAAAVACAVAVAQTPPGPPPPDPRVDERIAERAESMRQQIVEGRQVKSHVRVAVRLKNGNKLLGVVKDGRLVERVDGLRFVDAQAKERGAGIRLWYTGGTRNYVFVPFADFASYEVLERLSNKQIEELEQEMQMAERRAAERAPAKQATPPGKPGDETPRSDAPPGAEQPSGSTPAKPPVAGGSGQDGGEPPGGDTQAEMERQRQLLKLVQDYPPADGWNKARRDEISRRFVVVGAQPNAKEKRFVEVYEQWLQACSHFGLDPEEAQRADSADGKRGRSRRKN